MGSTRTAWHVLLVALLSQRGSRRFEVRSEVPLSEMLSEIPKVKMVMEDVRALLAPVNRASSDG